MNKYSADYIFDPIQKKLLKDHLIVCNGNEIKSLEPLTDDNRYDVKQYKGILSPGFVNAHCHLELSHMKGIIPSGTGLLPFLKKVVSLREFPKEEIQLAIKNADQEMHESGIVAVGDISNTANSAITKSFSSINYYSFVEMFDFLNAGMTDGAISQYEPVYNELKETLKHKKSLVPHSPYTVSKGLFEYIRNGNNGHGTVSIHNQEVPEENELFVSGTGGFIDFFEGFGLPLQNWKATGKRAIHYAIEHMNPIQKTIFVHNTTSNNTDLEAALDWSSNTFWATCPNANLYIENALPDYKIFIDNGAKMLIGTDSLSSNWQLSIWEEIKTISKYNSFIPLEEILSWATINGAQALNFDQYLGSFESGNKPGIVHIDYLPGNDHHKLQNSTSRLILPSF